MHAKSDNTEIMINDKVDETMEKLFNHFFLDIQLGLKHKKDSDFVFDCIHLLYYKCHKINPSCGISYIDSPDWIKSKKAIINPINIKDSKCFQYDITVASNHKEIKAHLKE